MNKEVPFWQIAKALNYTQHRPTLVSKYFSQNAWAQQYVMSWILSGSWNTCIHKSKVQIWKHFRCGLGTALAIYLYPYSASYKSPSLESLPSSLLSKTFIRYLLPANDSIFITNISFAPMPVKLRRNCLTSSLCHPSLRTQVPASCDLAWASQQFSAMLCLWSLISTAG